MCSQLMRAQQLSYQCSLTRFILKQSDSLTCSKLNYGGVAVIVIR